MNLTPKTLTVTECHQLLHTLKITDGTPDQRKKYLRNHTMAVLMLYAGLRVGEVVNLLISDLYYGGVPVECLTVRAKIAKNKTERTVPLSSMIRDVLVTYAESVLTDQPDFVPCFFHPWKNGYRIMTTRQVERIIRQAALRSIGRPVHPHVLRHTFGTRLMRITNARVVQQLLGHKHLSSTQIYMHPNQDDLKTAVESLDTNQPNKDVTESRSTSIADTANGMDTMHTNRDMR